jgi:predicted O-methyltransferase YrrM
VAARDLMLLGLVGVLVSDAPRVELAPEERFFRSEIATSVDGVGEGRYLFSSGWHVRHIELWSEVLADLKGRPDLRYLEVGVFEGRSLIWMLENVLTHPSARATAIDLFGSEYEAVFDDNLEASGFAYKVTKLAGPSARELRGLELGTYHVVYIDGSHTADDVLLDAALSWDLLAPGGLMIFDDYAWPGRHGEPLPAELRPQLAIDAFVAANRYALEIVHRDYQLIVRKRNNPCVPKDYCTPVGQYNYFWRARELWTRSGSKVELAPAELEVVERIARSYPEGEVDIRLEPGVADDAEVAALIAKLSLEL